MNRNYILFDTPARDQLYPFTLTRPVSACRTGILTIQEKWELWLQAPCSYYTVHWLQEKYPLPEMDADSLQVLINGHLLPDAALVAAVQGMEEGYELYKDNQLIAKAIKGKDFLHPSCKRLDYHAPVLQVQLPWDFSQLNDKALRADFVKLTAGRTSAPLSSTNQVLGAGQVFVEAGAQVEFCLLNAMEGPIYIGKNALVMEGSLIRGPFALGEGAVLKMGTKVYGATSIGPNCIGGGEIKNSVIFGYSNKAHDGYLGDSVIGEWCNLGANTTNSNLKNNAGTVKVWMEAKKEAWPAGRKCGLMMGDYSRAAINTSFNTGTVVGVSCNVFGAGLTDKFIPSFAWGTGQYVLEAAFRDIAAWKELKGKSLLAADKTILRAIFERVYENMAALEIV
ncbi:UDP-N-acetylglucosamine diphosphorylase/glucosamine-1-phosphate N-acetyltransferase [Chitinophaga costaii]|uniref:UDP-N-acetylglucosamine diphosphorylase/glucosamine-1-phosphate N-acetyltransferase n=1 Tax=Chitinophaga costaii TaxID=1335309 RepID=A0A1C4E4V9_9BACT|nr:putative sugar nucleotidyl transferase [Chitinophaga costaii]PUZ24318.1 glucose-1-phosphate thymidylyltransferase [Chitinophaga costaii]SCC38697.1 UDP-N-acetylglucosamine diphosphorylase/glucosamine-1-phosphate N-acetyltransferase [Chitinophaga costaii]